MKYEHILVTHFKQRCSLIWCEQTNKAAWIDPGGDIELLIESTKNKDLTFEKILLTHGHGDHIAGAKQLAEYYHIPIIGPESADTFLFEALPAQCQMMQLPLCDVFFPDQWLTDGELVTLGHETLQVMHCPGHTPGHVIFVSRSANTLFGGDVLFYESIGRTDFMLSSYDTLIESIKHKLFMLPDDMIVVPGHGHLTTIGHEKIHNPYVKIK